MLDEKLVELREVSLHRGTVQILDRVSFSIAPFQHTAIIGRNGCGKSSLLRLLTRQDFPSVMPDGSQGRVEILGRSDWHIDDLRSWISVVSPRLDFDFQVGQTGRMSVRQTLISGINGSRLPVALPKPRPDQQESIEEQTRRWGLDHLADRRVGTLSTGERRRCLIARALVSSPKLLVLDEPVTGLDAVASAELKALVEQSMLDGDTTIVLVTHELEDVTTPFQQAVLMSRGRIVRSGPVDRTICSETIKKTFGPGVDMDVSTRRLIVRKELK